MPTPIRGTIAFWIAPSGEIHLVKDTHIQYVIDHPELFQISLEALRRRYDDYGEEWGSEGQAREGNPRTGHRGLDSHPPLSGSLFGQRPRL